MATKLSSLRNVFRKALYFAFWGGIGGLSGAVAGEVIDFRPSSLLELLLNVGMWFAVIGGFIAFALLWGNERYARQLIMRLGAPGARIVIGTAFGMISGFVAGVIAQGLYHSLGATEPVRVFCWGVAGGLLGFAVSFRIRNLTWKRGAGGGFLGGLAGGALFVGISMVLGDVLGRLAGVTVIGVAIGLMLTLADEVFRKAWLEVQYGPKEVRTITLGAEPVRIGSSASSVEIFVKNVAAQERAYTFIGGQIMCEETAVGKHGPAPVGVPVHVGSIVITPHANSKAGKTAELAVTVSPSIYPSTDIGGFYLSMQNGRRFKLDDGVCLQTSELNGLKAPKGTKTVAEVVRHPEDQAVFGLKNCSDIVWQATLPTGSIATIDPGRSLRIQIGARIDFGAALGKIVSS